MSFLFKMLIIFLILEGWILFGSVIVWFLMCFVLVIIMVIVDWVVKGKICSCFNLWLIVFGFSIIDVKFVKLDKICVDFWMSCFSFIMCLVNIECIVEMLFVFKCCGDIRWLI